MPPKTKPAATSCSKSKSKSKKKKSGGDDMYGTRWTRSANDAQPQSQGHYYDIPYGYRNSGSSSGRVNVAEEPYYGSNTSHNSTPNSHPYEYQNKPFKERFMNSLRSLNPFYTRPVTGNASGSSTSGGKKKKEKRKK
jgi:hypothetical protein